MALQAPFPSFAFDACEKGGGGGLKLEFHLMDMEPPNLQSIPIIVGCAYFNLTHHQIVE